ncbi:MAG: GNAT family protein [Candidatus Dormiibacterota bacterium]
MIRPTFPIETPRLLLRPLVAGDLADVFAYRSRADVVRYLYEEPATEAKLTEELARKSTKVSIEREGDGLCLAVVPRASGRVVGDVVLSWTSEAHQQGEIGFVLHPDHQGLGYAHEASSVLLTLGFDELGLHRIVGRLDARNLASARLLQRLGMRCEAHLVENEYVKGEWTDEAVYALLASEWRATHA